MGKPARAPQVQGGHGAFCRLNTPRTFANSDLCKMPGSHLGWTAIGLCLVLIGLKSETEGLPQVCPQVTQGSSGLKWCAPRCQVLICPECCFNPICKTKRRKQCEWTQYLCANTASCNPPSDSGNLGLIKNGTILEASMETKLH